MPCINRKQGARFAITLALLLFGFGIGHPAQAAGVDLDVTIQVIAPDQDIQGAIDHDIALPSGHQATSELLHGDHAHPGSEARSESGGEVSDLSQQELKDSAEVDSIEEQTQELMDQAEQADQSVQDQEQETD